MEEYFTRLLFDPKGTTDSQESPWTFFDRLTRRESFMHRAKCLAAPGGAATYRKRSTNFPRRLYLPTFDPFSTLGYTDYKAVCLSYIYLHPLHSLSNTLIAFHLPTNAEAVASAIVPWPRAGTGPSLIGRRVGGCRGLLMPDRSQVELLLLRRRHDGF